MNEDVKKHLALLIKEELKSYVRSLEECIRETAARGGFGGGDLIKINEICVDYVNSFKENIIDIVMKSVEGNDYHSSPEAIYKFSLEYLNSGIEEFDKKRFIKPQKAFGEIPENAKNELDLSYKYKIYRSDMKSEILKRYQSIQKERGKTIEARIWYWAKNKWYIAIPILVVSILAWLTKQSSGLQ